MLFMRGNLDHAVSTRIHDRLAGADVFLAEILDHLRA